uniref:Uncharacterized protein n=2 Tax=Romanomermis culicivorax TaxID=13658 RepID=A0A915L5B1_ROMCU
MSDDDEPPLENSNMDNDSAFEKDDNIEDDSGIDKDLNDNGGNSVCFQLKNKLKNNRRNLKWLKVNKNKSKAQKKRNELTTTIWVHHCPAETCNRHCNDILQ